MPNESENEHKGRDWVDVLDLITKIAIPLVVFLVGIGYSMHQDTLADLRKKTDEALADKRRLNDGQFEYLKLLVSKAPEDEQLGMDMLDRSVRRYELSAELVAALTVYSSGAKGQALADKANRILDKAGIGNSSDTKESPATSAAASSAVKVYIQIANEQQKPDAERLRDALNKEGFAVNPIETVTSDVATVNNYVRFFAATGAAPASKAKQIMTSLGYETGIQDFSAYSEKPLSSLEIWIGKKQQPLAGK